VLTEPAASGNTAGAATSAKLPVKRLNPIKLKQLEDRVAAIEGELSDLETRIATAEDHLGHFVSAEDSQRTATELDQMRERRNQLTAQWEDLATQLEEQATAV